MTQADRVFSTPPTNTSAGQSRRSILGAIAAGSIATLAPTIADPVALPDPVFGLIEAHRNAQRDHEAALAEQNRLELIDDPAADWIAETPCHADAAAFAALIETAPVTFAGLTAWLAYLNEIAEHDAWRFDEVGATVVVSFAETLRRLAVQS